MMMMMNLPIRGMPGCSPGQPVGVESVGKGESVAKANFRSLHPGFRQVPEGSGEKGKMEETGCEIICGAPTTFPRD